MKWDAVFYSGISDLQYLQFFYYRTVPAGHQFMIQLSLRGSYRRFPGFQSKFGRVYPFKKTDPPTEIGFSVIVPAEIQQD